jgi:hypothetical protein
MISKFAVPEIPKVYHGAKTHFPSRAVVLEWDILCLRRDTCGVLCSISGPTNSRPQRIHGDLLMIDAGDDNDELNEIFQRCKACFCTE